MFRSELLKDNDDSNDKEMNNKYLAPRPQKQFEHNNDTNKVQNVSSTSNINIFIYDFFY